MDTTVIMSSGADSVMLRHKTIPDLFLHYDPTHGHYLIAEGVRGACAFSPDNAREMLRALDPQVAEHLKLATCSGPVVHVGTGAERPAPPTGEAARIYRELYETESYRKARVARVARVASPTLHSRVA